MKQLRKLYDWVLHWADTPHGPAALFLLSFAEASFFPVPPDVLLIALALGARKRAFRFALTCSSASVLGALFGFSIGHFLWWTGEGAFSPIALFFFEIIPGFTESTFQALRVKYDVWNFWIIFTAGFTPIPFKIFTISAGAFDINLFMFFIASTISRTARFFLIGGLIWKFGDPIRGFIDKYFNWLALLFTVLLFGGFFLVKYLI